jgi:hypothetical protein
VLTLPVGNVTDLIAGTPVPSLQKTLAPHEVWVLKVAR